MAYIAMNVAETSPFTNSDVREAVRYAINYDELQTLLQGNAYLTQEIIPVSLLGHTGLTPFKYNPEKAKSLLKQAGIAEGTTIDFLVPTNAAPGGVEWYAIAAKIQNDLQNVGLLLNIVQTEQLLERYRAGDHKMVMTLWSPDFPDPDANVTPFTDYETQSVAWRNQWNAPDITTLARQAASEQDASKRTELYKTITQRVQHEGPYAMLYQPARLYGVNVSVQGFQYSAAHSPSIMFSLISKNSSK
jgi:peptide/nickel transport system substrate-binding protein